ncbi:MAG: hypothetical protein LBH80_00580 [Prevotellaceae bacterium]|nr:hypothetical protein [Prevotellaceae bacterium]
MSAKIQTFLFVRHVPVFICFYRYRYVVRTFRERFQERMLRDRDGASEQGVMEYRNGASDRTSWSTGRGVAGRSPAEGVAEDANGG